DKNPDEDIFPKPTIFLPSADEVKLHNTGTYLCLLEDFFPDVITIDWKEKNGKTILKSQQGDTMKTKDTYMKYTWLTVPKKSMDKEHKCTVKHENNKGGVNREILFPSINKDLLPGDPLNTCSRTSCHCHLVQLANTSAYYTYVVLVVKSMVYTVIITICLLGGPALCDNGKSS
uniref:T cell receptor gamma constant 2 n=1 Tax=Panthera leo TaxID=9689 RepID=A0A8C9DAK4_PANLE